MEDLKAIYALRTTEEAFLDDGKERNLALLVSSIGNFLEENEKKKIFVNNKGIKLIIHRI